MPHCGSILACCSSLNVQVALGPPGSSPKLPAELGLSTHPAKGSSTTVSGPAAVQVTSGESTNHRPLRHFEATQSGVTVGTAFHRPGPPSGTVQATACSSFNHSTRASRSGRSRYIDTRGTRQVWRRPRAHRGNTPGRNASPALPITSPVVPTKGPAGSTGCSAGVRGRTPPGNARPSRRWTIAGPLFVRRRTPPDSRRGLAARPHNLEHPARPRGGAALPRAAGVPLSSAAHRHLRARPDAGKVGLTYGRALSDDRHARPPVIARLREVGMPSRRCTPRPVTARSSRPGSTCTSETMGREEYARAMAATPTARRCEERSARPRTDLRGPPGSAQPRRRMIRHRPRHRSTLASVLRSVVRFHR